MKPRISTVFLALVLVQIAHSVEEYVFRFYELFPPAKFINGLLPGFAHSAFILLNTFFAAFGLWCFFRDVRPGTQFARDWIWVWVVVELFNGVAHPLWAVAARGYVPGLATSPFLFVLAGYLLRRLRMPAEPSGPRGAP